MRLLLDHEPLVIQDSGLTPLAAYLSYVKPKKAHPGVLRLLLAAGADETSRDVYGETVTAKATKLGLTLSDYR